MLSLENVVSALVAVFVFVVPGFIWSYIFFPGGTRLVNKAKERGDAGTDIVERMVLSVAFSFALVPLSLFVANIILNTKVDSAFSLGVSLIVATVGLAVLYVTSRSVYLRWLSIVRGVRTKLFRS